MIETTTTANLWVGDWARPADDPNAKFERVHALEQIDGRTWRVELGGRSITCGNVLWTTSDNKNEPT